VPSPVDIFFRFLMLTALAALASCQDAAPAGPLERLAEIHDVRSVGPRISIETRHRPCTTSGGTADTVARITCSSRLPPPHTDLLALATEVSALVGTRAEAEAMHAAGLLDLLWRAGSGNSTDRAISYLTAAARLSDSPADALADLAAAHLIRAEEAGSPRDLLRALDAAAHAEALEPGHRAAMYNLALALDRLTADASAADAWNRYRQVDGSSGWGSEAYDRAGALESARTLPAPPRLTDPAARVRAYARETPQQARLLGWDVRLGDWGHAVLRSDTGIAVANLRAARVLAEELANAGGDASLADAIRVIDMASGSVGRTRALARAHRAYSTGRGYLLDSRLRLARDSFEVAASTRHGSDALRAWARTYEATTIMLDGRLDEGWSRLSELLARADPARHPSLAGQMSAAMSTARLRAGSYEDAIEYARAAAAHYREAGEREALGSQVYLQADSYLAIGAAESAYRSMYEALRVLRPYRRSVWRYNAMWQLGAVAADEGLLRPAIRLMTEAIAVADRSGTVLLRVDGRLGRAPLLAMAGDSAAAREDLALSRALLPSVESARSREWLLTDLRLAESAMSATAEPRTAIAVLDSILSEPGATGTETRLLTALISRADARLAIGEPTEAASDLERAADLISRESERMTRSSLRAALLDDARAVFDRLALLEIARGEPLRALEHLERGRLSLTRGAGRTRDGDHAIPAMPEGQTAVSYLLAGDTLLAWIVRPAGVELVRSMVDGDDLARTIELVRASLELGAGEETLESGLARLHDWLIAPVRGRLGDGISRMVVVADGAIAGVPFPALINRDSARYLIEDYELRIASSLRDVAGSDPAGAIPAREATAVFMGNPGAGSDTRGFAPLPGSAEEVRTLAALYTEPRVVMGDSITASTVTRALQRSEIFHFAGHAVFDDARPELSFLVTAPGPDGEPDRLPAVALHGLDLRHVRLVVLAACETLRSGTGRSGGFAGFAGVLIQSGVDGVVGSLWRVDDEATTRLMVAFHERFSAAGDGPASLRAAQLRLLRSSDPALSSPAAWAGFQYAGN
jgi:CHAT domain-containing protein/tetratricopeptide (TPR) repeat protein